MPTTATTAKNLSEAAERCLRDMRKHRGYHGQAASHEARMELVAAGLARIVDGYSTDLRIVLAN